MTGLSPYNSDNDVACVSRIAKGCPPADPLALDIPVPFQSMLSLCWDQDQLARPGITRCLAIMELQKDFQDSNMVYDIFTPPRKVITTVPISKVEPGPVTRLTSVSPSQRKGWIRVLCSDRKTRYISQKQDEYGLLTCARREDALLVSWDPISSQDLVTISESAFLWYNFLSDSLDFFSNRLDPR
jgi:hypothetical protein